MTKVQSSAMKKAVTLFSLLMLGGCYQTELLRPESMGRNSENNWDLSITKKSGEKVSFVAGHYAIQQDSDSTRAIWGQGRVSKSDTSRIFNYFEGTIPLDSSVVVIEREKPIEWLFYALPVAGLVTLGFLLAVFLSRQQ
jgi:hypothetical protein